MHSCYNLILQIIHVSAHDGPSSESHFRNTSITV